MQIVTNSHWRPFAYALDVPKDVLNDQFDWMRDEDGEHDTESYCDGFFRYRGHWYHISEFTARDDVPGFQAMACDTYFSGVAIAVSDDGEAYKVATVLA
ncbi:MAG: hypothetical protein KJN60_11315 [Boseongicola sp.]|nr:hypothetical protein [Boseongicola sp.]